MWRALVDHPDMLRRKASEGVIAVHENGIVRVEDGAPVDPHVLQEWIDDEEWIFLG